MLLSNVSIQRPVFTVMVTIALMTLGLIAVRSIGVDLFPDVSFPIVVVRTIYPGASPEEVEQSVSRKIEEAVSSVNGVDEVRSTSQDSVSVVFIQFKLEADVKSAAADVRERVASIRYDLPRDIESPVVDRFDPTALPVVTYVVSSKRDPVETRRIVEDQLKPKLEALDGVGQVKLIGGLEREVHIYVDGAKLRSMGLSVAALAQQLGQEGFDLPAGHITGTTTELDVKTEGRYRSIDELRNVIVASLPSGAQVRLSDVARIEDGYKEVRKLTRLDGLSSVAIEIQKQGGSNTVAVADKVATKIAQVQPDLPPDLKLKKAIDGSTFIRRNIEDVTRDLVFGGLMAILVIFVFMLDWRSTLISSLSLPTSVVTTFFVMWYLGFTFNMMTLMALSLSIGLLIDDAVVVRENIFRHMERGKDAISAARDATSEIGLAVMATTFTIVAVFVPVAFMGGLIGRFFKQFGLTIAAAVLVSLFVSFTLDPMMSAHVMKPVGPGHHEEMKHHRIFGPIIRMYDGLDSWYRELLRWAVDFHRPKLTDAQLDQLSFIGRVAHALRCNRNRILIAIGAGVLFFTSLGLTAFMGKEFVTPEDRGEFRVDLEMPAGISLEEMNKITERAEVSIHQASPHVKSLYVVVGADEQTNKTVMRVFADKAEERHPVTQWDIEAAIRKELAKIPNLTFSVTDLGIVDGPFVQHPVTFFIRGDDFTKLKEISDQAMQVVKNVPGIVDPDTSLRGGRPETSVHIDREKAADLGVNVGLIAQTMRLAIQGDVVSKYRSGDRDYDVRLQLDPEQLKGLDGVRALTVPVTGQKLGARPTMPGAPRFVEVGEISEVASGSTPATINRQNRQRQVIVTANLAKGVPLGDVTNAINAGLAKIDMPPGYGVTWFGQAKDMQDTFKNMVLAMAVAILFIFFVLASQFESIIHPFTIMIALPLAIVGAFLLMFLTGTTIGMSAMIGMILLLGLVTKNAILLVDYTNELRETRGMSMLDALLEAGPTRLRPILMTSSAMVLGMMPGAVLKGEGSEFKAPMAIAVIGGVIASTLLTLVVVPVVYTWLDRFTSRGRAERSGAPPRSHGITHVGAHPAVDVHPVPAAAAMVATEPEAEAALLTNALVEKA